MTHYNDPYGIENFKAKRRQEQERRERNATTVEHIEQDLKDIQKKLGNV